jgi:hypothetical protein
MTVLNTLNLRKRLTRSRRDESERASSVIGAGGQLVGVSASLESHCCISARSASVRAAG